MKQSMLSIPANLLSMKPPIATLRRDLSRLLLFYCNLDTVHTHSMVWCCEKNQWGFVFTVFTKKVMWKQSKSGALPLKKVMWPQPQCTISYSHISTFKTQKNLHKFCCRDVSLFIWNVTYNTLAYIYYARQ